MLSQQSSDWSNPGEFTCEKKRFLVIAGGLAETGLNGNMNHRCIWYYAAVNWNAAIQTNAEECMRTLDKAALMYLFTGAAAAQIST